MSIKLLFAALVLMLSAIEYQWYEESVNQTMTQVMMERQEVLNGERH